MVDEIKADIKAENKTENNNTNIVENQTVILTTDNIIKEWLHSINWLKFFILCFFVLLITVGTFRDVMSKFEMAVAVCSALGNFGWGFFTSGTKR